MRSLMYNTAIPSDLLPFGALYTLGSQFAGRRATGPETVVQGLPYRVSGPVGQSGIQPWQIFQDPQAAGWGHYRNTSLVIEPIVIEFPYAVVVQRLEMAGGFTQTLGLPNFIHVEVLDQRVNPLGVWSQIFWSTNGNGGYTFNEGATFRVEIPSKFLRFRPVASSGYSLLPTTIHGVNADVL